MEPAGGSRLPRLYNNAGVTFAITVQGQGNRLGMIITTGEPGKKMAPPTMRRQVKGGNVQDAAPREGTAIVTRSCPVGGRDGHVAVWMPVEMRPSG
jgi:hypothetical protein